MRKLLLSSTLALSSLHADPSLCKSLSDHYNPCPLSVNITSDLGYESRFLYRGSKLAKQTILFSTQISQTYQFEDVDLEPYIATWAAIPFQNSENAAAQQITPSIGLIIYPHFPASIELGYLHYTFSNTDYGSFPLNRNFRNRNCSYQNELFFGASLDILLSPSLYVFYNFDLHQWTIEPSLQHSFHIANINRNSICLDLSLKTGWIHAKNFNGKHLPSGFNHQTNAYFYAKIQADLTIHLNDHASLSIGPRYSANNDGSTIGVNNLGFFNANAIDGNAHTFYWGAHLKFDI